MLRVLQTQHGVGNSAFNGTFEVTAITNDKEFQYTTTDTDGKTHNTGILQVILLIEQSIYHDSKEMIYNQTYTSIVVK